MGGQHFDLANDASILSINSPRMSINGPYKVVFKNIIERWAIVVLDFDGEPRLGIRWFWGNSGSPFSRRPTWFIVPPDLSSNMLQGLPIYPEFKDRIADFLSKKLSGSQL